MSLIAHPSLPEFDYIKPQTLVEASQFLAAYPGEARPLMGGTDIFVRMRDGIWTDKYLVDVKSLGGMNKIEYDPIEGLYIGAAVNMNRVIVSQTVKEKYPILAEASNSCASYQLRTRATIVGNICNASPAGDTIGACILLGGILNVHGVDGTRQEPLNTFFLGPGKTRLKAGDIVTSIRLPVPSKGMVGKYIKHGRNKISDLAIVGITVVGWPDDDLPSGVRIRLALASVAPVPLIVDRVETILSEKKISEQVVAEAAQAAMSACDPIDDVRASARYRKVMVRNLSVKALTEVWKRLKR
jgi:CO/xanthine dehydrogenase FAD-binding subunit